MDTRKALRNELRIKRRSLTAQQQRVASKRLLQNLLKIPGIHRAHKIAIYLPNDGEIDTRDITQWCRKKNKQLYLPVLHPFSHNRLWFVKFTARTPMTKNIYKIMEPRRPYISMQSAKQLDVVLLPLVGFDPNGGRLGMGGGYYDRTFSYLKNLKLNKPRLFGLAHDLQKVEGLPVESWDVPLSGIASDRMFYRA